MANRQVTLTSSYTNHRTSLSNNILPSNLNSNNNKRIGQNKKISTVPEMSPEARRAILMAREDSKVHNKIKSCRNADGSPPVASSFENDRDCSDHIDPNNNSNTNLIVRKKEQQDNIRPSNLNVKIPNRKTTKLSSSSSSSRPPRAPKTGTARSRSTLSQNEPPFSMSDNNEISTASNASVYTSNMSSGININYSSSHSGNIGSNRLTNNHLTDVVNAADDDDNDSALPNDESFDDEEDDETSFHTTSFVLALDKALEKSYVSRLKGDITDTATVSKPGTVRALNGGRLTNAQEVVVNVCHNDDTELVFHDDDDESMDTAKAISQIRVKIWMEYNSKFPPDNNNMNDMTNGADHDAPIDNESKKKKESSLQTTASRPGRQPSASVANNKTREKSAALLGERGIRRLSGSTVGGGSVKAGTVSSNAGPSGSSHLDKPKSSTAGNNNLKLQNVPISPSTSRKSTTASSSRGKTIGSSVTSKQGTPSKTKR